MPLSVQHGKHKATLSLAEPPKGGRTHSVLKGASGIVLNVPKDVKLGAFCQFANRNLSDFVNLSCSAV